MLNYEEPTTLLANCRKLYEDVNSFKEKAFEKDIYEQLNKDILNLNTLLDNLLKNPDNTLDETDENKLFITNLGGIKLSLNHIKTSINPNFRVKDENNKWLIMANFFKNPSPPPLQHRQQIGDYLANLAGGLNLLEKFLPTNNSNNQLKR